MVDRLGIFPRDVSLSSDNDCLVLLETIRWNGKPVCPYCGSLRITAIPKERRYRCNGCNTAFSATVGTIFHCTRLSLRKWFAAVSVVLEARKPISARRLAEQLNVNKNTGWYLNTRIRTAMLEPSQRDLLLEIADMNEVRAVERT